MNKNDNSNTEVLVCSNIGSPNSSIAKTFKIKVVKNTDHQFWLELLALFRTFIFKKY